MILPYHFAGEFVSELHISLAFIALVLLTYSLYRSLWDFNYIDYNLAHKLRLQMYLTAFVIILIYSKFLLINGLMEIIFCLSIMDIFAKLEKAMTSKV